MGEMDMLGMGGTNMGMGGMDIGMGMGGMVIGMGGMDMGMGGMDMLGMGGMDMGMAGMPPVGGIVDDLNSGPDTMGWTGCSMGENTAIGYRRIGGTRMWGSNGNGGAVVQQWTSENNSTWQRFDQMAQQSGGPPVAVWIMICIFAQAGATEAEVNQMISIARSHAADNAVIYLTGQPVYSDGNVCTLAGNGGPELTDNLAKQVADQHDDVIYPGQLVLDSGEVSGDTCHANATGEDELGKQARAYWGQP
jgi:hypothetical protein